MKVNYEARILLSNMVSKYCAHCDGPAVESEACDRCGQPVCESKDCARECGAYLDDADRLMAITRSWMNGDFLPSDLSLRLRSVRLLVDAGLPGYERIAEPDITILTHCEMCYAVGSLEPYLGSRNCPACGNICPSKEQIFK